MAKRVYAEKWESTLTKWSANTQEDQVPLSVLQNALQEDPQQWTGGKGSYLTKILVGLGWLSQKSPNGRVYHKAKSNGTNGKTTPVTNGKNGSHKKHLKLETITIQAAALVKQIEGLSVTIHGMTDENTQLKSLLDFRNLEIQKMIERIGKLENGKQQNVSKASQVLNNLRNKLDEQTKRAALLQKQNEEAALDRDAFRDEIKLLKKQLKKSPKASPGSRKKTTTTGQKSIRDLFDWVGVKTNPRIIATGHNGKMGNIEIEILDDGRIIRRVKLDGNARIKRRINLTGSTRVYESIHLDDPVSNLIKIFKPYRKYYQGFIEIALLDACEMLGSPLSVDTF